MCDTLGIHRGQERALFAKNSDRSPNEPQVPEYIRAAKHTENTVRATYIEVEQARETRALLLSRPVWMFGGEMGVNESGVVIGNEAVFTKGKYGPPALTGMDLLRLALERADTAHQALETILALLEQYGQGGNCGYDHKFEYNNAFLIMDKDEVLVLDTRGKDWAWKRFEKTSISNRLSIEDDADAYSGERLNFKATYSDRLFTHFSGSGKRRACTLARLGDDADEFALMAALRAHEDKVSNPFARGSVASVCMHAGGLVGDHTTQSMIVLLDSTSAPMVWTTGGSTPCVSVFKPYLFGNPVCAPVFDADDPEACEYWLTHERFVRRFIGTQVPAEYYEQRDRLEADLLTQAAVNRHNPAAMAELAQYAWLEEKQLIDQWERDLTPGSLGSGRFRRYWEKKNAALGGKRPIIK